jgi:leader peptidase (prepilin peptidase) / N-methyltransferase
VEPFASIFDTRYWAAVPFHFWSAFSFVIGCFVGSFLNVCVHRMPLGLSIVSPPSHCPHCKHAIPWFLNVPVVTWLWLRGKCRHCGNPISPRYLLVELLTGALFLACWLEFGDRSQPYGSMPLALAYCVLISGLIVATFIDFEHFIIPDEITLGGCAVGFLCSLALPGLHGASSVTGSMLQSLLGMGVGAAVVYGILRLGKILFGREHIELEGGTRVLFSESALHLPDREIPYGDLFYRKSDAIVVQARELELVDRCYRDVRVHLTPESLTIGGEVMSPETVLHMEAACDEIVLPREAMGLGDVKFMAAIGAFLGWQSVLFSLMASSMIGAVVGVTLILVGKKEWSSRLPYGPYIAMAALLWVFWGRDHIPPPFR